MIDLTLFEPITHDNISDLKPGEWIWDNKQQCRRAHKQTIYDESVTEPIGFRQVHILDLSSFGVYNNKPFVLTSIDNHGFGNGSKWVYFEENRFFKFKKEQKDD